MPVCRPAISLTTAPLFGYVLPNEFNTCTFISSTIITTMRNIIVAIMFFIIYNIPSLASKEEDLKEKIFVQILKNKIIYIFYKLVGNIYKLYNDVISP